MSRIIKSNNEIKSHITKAFKENDTKAFFKKILVEEVLLYSMVAGEMLDEVSGSEKDKLVDFLLASDIGAMKRTA